MYTGRRAEPSFRFPQKLVKDTKGKKINVYAKQLALIIFSYVGRRTGKVNKMKRELAKLSGMSVDTVNRKLQELEKTGYIAVKRHRAKRDPETGRMTRSASEYTFIVPQKSFIMIPYRLVRKPKKGGLHSATLAVFLYIYRQIRKDHVYPSSSKIRKETSLAGSTVRTALKELDCAGLLYIQRCRKRNGAPAILNPCCMTTGLCVGGHWTPCRRIPRSCPVSLRGGTPIFRTTKIGLR